MAFTPSFEIDSDDAEQVSLLRELLAMGSLLRKPIRQDVERDRSWNAGCSTCDQHPAEIVGRHPNLQIQQLSHITPYVVSKVSRSIYRGRQGYFHSQKMDRTLHFRSRLEYGLMRICEVDWRVQSFVEQPVRLKYRQADGKVRTYTPDLLAQSEGSTTIFEVKWESDAMSPDNEARWPEIGDAFSKLGLHFKVITERSILRQPRQKNLTILLRARRVPRAGEETVATIKNLIQNGQRSISGLLHLTPGLTLKDIYRLILDGVLCVDLDGQLDARSELLLTGVGHA